MKTFIWAVLGVATALAAVAGWASMGSANSKSPRLTAPVATAVSFTKTGAIPATAEAAGVAAKFDRLSDHQMAPPAVVDHSSIRKIGRSSFMALRNDGSVCLSQRSTLVCYVGFEPGGISTSVGDGRTYDSSDAPFQVVIDGIAKDGVRSIAFELNDGSTATTTVTDNAFELTIPNHLANDLLGYRIQSDSGTMHYAYPAGHFPAPDAPMKITGR
jgi:hypothetical protein